MNRNDPEGITRDLRQGPLPEEDVSISGLSDDDSDNERSIPEYIGRYRVDRFLGRGGFGSVYLAYDASLERLVAVKVPHRKHLTDPGSGSEYLAEARVVAQLDHRHIVPVYDVGQTDDFPCYIVSKFVDGTNLAVARRLTPFTLDAGVTLLANIAEALHYAHRCGIVHRDVKPGNILIAKDGTPYITDFGLALREENVGHGERYIGTPSYMSPEQARGEGHRVDGRTDIYSLGVTLYELLTSRRPFQGGTTTEILDQIATTDPRPPRQIDDRIPREIERICLKALAPRMADRYTTALDLAADLRQFRTEELHRQNSSVSIPMAAVGSVPGSDNSRVDSTKRGISVVPKGLRSFDEHDSEFFLDLLPGPRDRDGLPTPLRFWKTGIEERDPSQAFSVGLIYGPSGCGKSSLVKAGLIPRLSSHVLPVYLEATPDETEVRLLKGLQRRCRSLQSTKTLKEAMASLRQGIGLPAEAKVLIVLDQFEQWLHSHRECEQSELLLALRQCDGVNVQCVLLVRDDFWMATTRFMTALEAPLVEGKNSAAVDLFPIRHAARVLTAFGRALGCLPDDGRPLAADQRQFVNDAVEALAENGKVICVRLALFAAMMQGKPWTPAGLRAVGGASGVGVAFLRETFEASTSPPAHRFHQGAAREVLKALLPTDGQNLKGEMKSRHDLLEASGYAAQPREFDELIRLLDAELRLITPTDRNIAGGSGAEGVSAEQTPHYQLTHDYLVPALQSWLTSRQRETARGRAELLLAERATIWNPHPSKRHLPSPFEYVGIVTLTSHDRWTAPERRMMFAAARHYRRRWLAAAMIFALTVTAGFAVRHRLNQEATKSRVDGVINQLLVADLGELPKITEVLDGERDNASKRLQSTAADGSRPTSERLRAAYALVDESGEHDSNLVSYALDADLETLRAIIARLSPVRPSLQSELWFLTGSQSAASAELRLGVMLAAMDPDATQWQELAPRVVEALLSENSLDFDEWVEEFRPTSAVLTPILVKRLSNPESAQRAQVAAARTLAHLADPELLCQLLLVADEPAKFVMLCAGVPWQDPGFVPMVRSKLAAISAQGQSGTAQRSNEIHRNGAILLMRLEAWAEAEPYLVAGSDPTARTMIMLRSREFGVLPEVLVRGIHECRDPTARQALILALEPYQGEELSASPEHDVEILLRDRLEQSPYQAERSAAEWVLRRWEKSAIVDATLRTLAEAPTAERVDRDWMTHPQGHVFRIFPGPVQFPFGAAPGEDGSTVEAPYSTLERRDVTIPYSFAVGICEVTFEQMKRFRPSLHPVAPYNTSEPRLVGNGITPELAIEYCRWLGEQEGLTEADQCYSADATLMAVLPLTDEQLKKPGYRLPTEIEWEYVCRSGSLTPWSFGADEKFLKEFAWCSLVSNGKVTSVATMRPNAFGFFDTSGNVGEWCHPLERLRDVEGAPRFLLRGGSYQSASKASHSALRYEQSKAGYSFDGFRIARTIDPASDGQTALKKAVTPE